MTPVREATVWDVPVRVFHWVLVVLVAVLFVTGKIGENWLEWHRLAGFTVLGLIVFRILWGVVGTRYARFTSFVRSPRTVWDYAKNVRRASAERAVGHNPMGGWSVLAMLLTLAVQATTGLFANDDVMLEGPWASAVSKETSDFLTHVHKINSNVLVALVVLHVLAILYYAIVHRENLVKAMITGKKRLDVPLEPISARWGWAIAAIVIAASLTYFIVKK